MAMVSGYCLADNRVAALNAAKNAALITSGISARMETVQKQYQEIFEKELTRLDIKEPAFVFGAIIKTARDKRIDFIYRGKSFSFTPNSMTVRIQF